MDTGIGLIDFTLLILAAAILITNYFFTRWFIRYAKVKRITDYPTERSSHEVPTPRGGGVGFVMFTILGTLIYSVITGIGNHADLLVLTVAALFVAILGWFDDKNDLSKRVRFSVQLFSAVIVLLAIQNFSSVYLPNGTVIHLGLIGLLPGLIWITGNTNIYNFMDGVDGIASVQALSASAGWIVFAFFWDQPSLLAFNVFLFCGVASFLLFNWSPAKIFMGDAGSLFLGFVFGAMPFLAAATVDSLSIGMAVWIGGLLLWPFLFDGAFTIFRRLYSRENIFQAHRSHLYQKMNIGGWKHHSISFIYLLFSLLSLLIALLFVYGSHTFQWILVVLLILFSLLFAAVVLMSDSDKKLNS
ncbi:MAG: glycosyltransferase family 4 protein [Balneolaceae bacterium]|nr:glycosyltransferase family 4 protein [Balneolaceae bacterium]